MIEYPLAPDFGRFQILRGPSKKEPILHVRLKKAHALEVISGASTFAGLLSSQNVHVRGLDDVSWCELVAVLIALPTTKGIIIKTENGDPTLELRCKDTSDVSLVMNIGLQSVDGSEIFRDALQGLMVASVGLEAVLQEYEAERESSGNQNTTPTHSALLDKDSLNAFRQPPMVKGKPVQVHPLFKRSVTRDIVDIGNRAYSLAFDAGRLREDRIWQNKSKKLEERAKHKEQLKREFDNHDLQRSAKVSNVSLSEGTSLADYLPKKEEIEDMDIEKSERPPEAAGANSTIGGRALQFNEVREEEDISKLDTTSLQRAPGSSPKINEDPGGVFASSPTASAKRQTSQDATHQIPQKKRKRRKFAF